MAIVGGKLRRIPPQGPLREVVAALPAALGERIAPLLRELPVDGAAANRLATQLTAVISKYRAQTLPAQRQP